MRGLETIDAMQDTTTFLLEELHQPSPEKRLAAAVFGAAIEDLACAEGNTDESRRRYRLVREWLIDPDESWPYAFVSLCLLFDFDPAVVRAALLAAGARRVSVGVRTRSRDTTRAVVRKPARGRRASWWSGARVPRGAKG